MEVFHQRRYKQDLKTFGTINIKYIKKQIPIYRKHIITNRARTNPTCLKWNNTQHEYPKGKCVHELFEEVVENNKDRIAVVYEDQQITYEVLNQRANQLAHYLRSRYKKITE